MVTIMTRAKAAPRGFAEPLPATVRDRMELTDRGRAFLAIHRPETMQDVAVASKDAGESA